VANVLQIFIMRRELEAGAASLKAQVRQYEREVRECRRAEETLRANEERFRAFSQNAPDIVYSLDVSHRGLHLCQPCLGEVLWRYFIRLRRARQAGRYVGLFKQVRDERQTLLTGVDGRLLTKDGKPRPSL